MDESRSIKIVRYSCDLPSKPWRASGVLGAIVVRSESIPETQEDRSTFGVRMLSQLIRRFCTPYADRRQGRNAKSSGQPLAPLGQKSCTETLRLMEHIIASVTTVAADGARSERRVLFLAARRLFKNVRMMIRDGAHAIRIAMEKPLHLDTTFGDIWTSLFDEKHSLVPSLQNSNKYGDIFKAAQRAVIAIPCNRHPLEEVYRCLGFAKHRYDSCASPQADSPRIRTSRAWVLAGHEGGRAPCRPLGLSGNPS